MPKKYTCCYCGFRSLEPFPKSEYHPVPCPPCLAKFKAQDEQPRTTIATFVLPLK